MSDMDTFRPVGHLQVRLSSSPEDENHADTLIFPA